MGSTYYLQSKFGNIRIFISYALSLIFVDKNTGHVTQLKSLVNSSLKKSCSILGAFSIKFAKSTNKNMKKNFCK